MIIDKPSYIVAELPESLADWVKNIRETFEPAIAHLPEEITLTGSSGVGVLVEGQRIEAIGQMIEESIKVKTRFSFRILGVRKFQGVDRFYAAPEREGFDNLHLALKESGIQFKESAYPYTPHCSLKGFTALKDGQREALEALVIPQESFQIKCISVYGMDKMQARKLLTFSNIM